MKQRITMTTSLATILLIGLTTTACGKKAETNSDIKPIINRNAGKEISDTFDKQNPAWKSYTGNWTIANGVLRQNSTKDSYPVILREDKNLDNVDIRVQFKPISGDIDASAGIIFRATDEDNYYIVRANALENNFRLYTFIDGYRHQLASATVTPPSLNKIHTMRVVANGDHIQVYLNNKLQLDHHDATFTTGYTGLWTKADSVTEFDNFDVLKLM